MSEVIIEGPSNWWWHSSWLEPTTATIAFAVVIHIYWFWERQEGLSDFKTLEFPSPLRPHQWGIFIQSALGYWIGIFLVRLVVAPKPSIPDGWIVDLPTALYRVLEVTSGIFLYDAIFFVLHVAMHHVKGLQRFHRFHHDHKSVECGDTLRHSLVDGTLQVAVNILVQQWTPWGTVRTRLARVLHNVLVVWMLVESHTRVPKGYVWRRWCIGVREHWRHHSDGGISVENQRYQQFFGYLDSALQKAALCQQEQKQKAGQNKQV